MKTALILPPTTFSFAPVAGLPLIQRTVLSAQRWGFDRIIVLGRGHAQELRRLFASDERMAGIEVTDTVGSLDGSEVALIASDHLVTADTFEQINAVQLDGQALLFGAAGQSGVALCRPTMLADIDLASLTASGAEALWAALRERGARGGLAGWRGVRADHRHALDGRGRGGVVRPPARQPARGTMDRWPTGSIAAFPCVSAAGSCAIRSCGRIRSR